MMTRLWIVALYTFLEGIRKRFLFILGGVCIFILCFGFLFGQISLDEQERLTMNFGLASLQIGLVIFSIFFGNTFFEEDLKRKIFLTVLARPLKPGLFFLGRYFGVSLLLLVSLTALSFLLTGAFLFLNIPLAITLPQTLFGFLLESLFLLAVVLLFSSLGSFFAPLYALGFFLIGHGSSSLVYALKEKAFLPHLLSWLPQLERVNWKSAVVYSDPIPFSEFLLSSLYLLSWTGFMLLLALWIFEKKDLI